MSETNLDIAEQEICISIIPAEDICIFYPRAAEGQSDAQENNFHQRTNGTIKELIERAAE